MDYETYRKKYFVDPQPEPRYAYAGIHGLALYFSDYAAAVSYYQRVLGPPGYVESEGTREWQLGDTSLTLLKGASGSPSNLEMIMAPS